MIEALKAFLLGGQRPRTSRPDAAQIAIIALLIRAATSDADFAEPERQAIARIAASYFHVSDVELTELMALAQAEEAQTMDLYRWAQTIKQHYDEAARIELIEKLWEVVYADGKLDDYEANLLRRVAGLIYVPDRESGQARLRVMARLGLQDR